MQSEKKLREDILEKTKQIYNLRNHKQVFIPGKSRVNYAGRVFDEKEMQAMIDSVLDFWLTLGKQGNHFINDFLQYTNMKHGLMLNSGSSANLVAVSSLCSESIDNPLKKGDEVITTAMCFPTTINPLIQNGLVPVLVDVEQGTYNIDTAKLEDAISEKTKAIIFAHTLGNPANMDDIIDISKKYNLYVIEDTCDALGSYFDNKLCGTFGDISTYSFYAAHHITMGEGGALLTNNADLYKQALSIRDWGRACFCPTGEQNPNGACKHRFDQKFEGLPSDYDHKYIYNNIGYNLKPLDIQCAMGIEQLKKLPEFGKKRRYNFEILNNAFKKYEDYFILPKKYPKSDPSWFAYPLTIKNNLFSRKNIVTYLEKSNIETRMLFTGNIIKHPAYKNIKYRISGDLTQTENILHNTFFIGLYPGMTKEMLNYTIDIIDNFMLNYNIKEF